MTSTARSSAGITSVAVAGVAVADDVAGSPAGYPGVPSGLSPREEKLKSRRQQPQRQPAGSGEVAEALAGLGP